MSKPVESLQKLNGIKNARRGTIQVRSNSLTFCWFLVAIRQQLHPPVSPAVTHCSLRTGLPLAVLFVSGSPSSSLKKAYSDTEKPRACRISCFTVESSVSASCRLTLMDDGHRLTWPAMGLGEGWRLG